MFLRAVLALLILPGVFAGIVPAVLLSLDPWRGDGWTAGAGILACGIGGLLWCVRDFYVAGKGTLAPWDPPQKLVVVGLYRFTRNPMYFSVLLVLVGWSVWFGSPIVAAYTVLVAVAFHLRVALYEEPWLAQKHGASWTYFADNVPRWLPRLRPW